MEKIYSEKEEDFEFEKYICFEKPEVWLLEANKLFYSAQVLFEFQNLNSYSFDKAENRLEQLFSEEVTKASPFNWRNQRMLWAYGFENIFKGIIICGIRIESPELQQVPIDRIRSHNLTYLGKMAGMILPSDDTFYLGVLEKCSTWAGRYPLPARSSQMYQKRAPMKSREALFERHKRLYEDYTKGRIYRMECESDVLHSQISNVEYEFYRDLKSKAITRFRELST